MNILIISNRMDSVIKWYVTTNGKMQLNKNDKTSIDVISNIKRYGTFSLHNIQCNMPDAQLIGENILLTLNGVEESDNNIWIYFTPNINIREYCSASIKMPGSKDAITNYNEIIKVGSTSLLADNYSNGLADPDVPFSHDMNLFTFYDTNVPASAYQMNNAKDINRISHENDYINPPSPYIDDSVFRTINDGTALPLSAADAQGLSKGNALYNSRQDKDRAVSNQTAQDRAVSNQTAQDRAVSNGTAQDRAVSNQTAQDRAVIIDKDYHTSKTILFLVIILSIFCVFMFLFFKL